MLNKNVTRATYRTDEKKLKKFRKVKIKLSINDNTKSP